MKVDSNSDDTRVTLLISGQLTFWNDRHWMIMGICAPIKRVISDVTFRAKLPSLSREKKKEESM